MRELVPCGGLAYYLLWGALLAAISLALLVPGVRLAWAGPARITLPWRRARASR